ncbi:MAG TPA: NADPH-dependent FMN reductase [Mucilaginibacter sp.]|nr:NADPH-dependent FMN reductase [Mucilaginibacter sp.]
MSAAKKNIFAISGSLRAGSSNHTILEYLQSLAPPTINYVIYDGIPGIPAFDPGLDNDDPPKFVIELREHIANADAIIICTPEYAYGVPGALKNALDWTVSSGSFSGKTVALITASTGGENAHEAMIKILGAIDAKLTPETTLLLSFIRTKIANGQITDETTIEKLKYVFSCLLNTIE